MVGSRTGTIGTTLGRRGFLAGAAGGIALGTLALAGCATPGKAAAGGTTLRFYEQKQEVIAYFDKLLRRFEREHAGVSVVHDSTTAIAPQFVRGQPADVGCFNDNLELARYVERGVLRDLSALPSADRIRPSIAALGDQYAKYPGRVSVLPYSLAAAGVIYNKRILRGPRPAGPHDLARVRRRVHRAAEGGHHAGLRHRP